MKQVIIGGSIAAVGAIAGIRSLAPDDEIIVINGERREVYSRPMISYLLGGGTPVAIQYPEAGYLRKNRVTVINEWAQSISRNTRQLSLANGEQISYDRLLLATGSVPLWPSITGIDNSNVYSFYTLDDAEKLKLLATKGKIAVVIGSGLIGIKAAEALHRAGVSVTILEREATLMPRLLPTAVAEQIRIELARMGIGSLTGQQVVSLDTKRVKLADGRMIPSDIVVMAVGVRPRAEMATGCGLMVEKGIKVNGLLQTSDPLIYAAGDVVQISNLVSGQQEVMALLPLAREQGFIAGVNMAGRSRIYSGRVPLNAGRIGAMAISSGGISNNPDLSWRCWQNDNCYLELFARDNRLAGFIAINLPMVCGPLYNTLKKSLDIEIGAWQRFMERPSVSMVPAKYWQELRRCLGHDHLECS